MLLHVARVIFILVEVVVLFNLLIVVHEIGHFLAARWRGLYIEKFGIWFGKPLWRKTINGVEYSLGSLPFGGFVALPQLAPMDIIEGKADIDRAKLPPISALDKSIVAFAGPLFSFLLAVVFAVIIWAVGRPVSEAEATTTVGYVLPGTPAAKAGLQPGDKILSIDGDPVSRFAGMANDSITWRIVRSEGQEIAIVIDRAGEKKTIEVTPTIRETKPWMRKAFREIGIVPAETPVVAKVQPGTAAAKAGVQPKDVITSINGERVYNILAVGDYVRAHSTEPLMLGLRRGGEDTSVPIEPETPTVGDVYEKSPAAQAGLKTEDIIVALDGQPVRSAQKISDYVKQRAGQPIKMAILRKGEQLEVTVTPQVPEDVPDSEKKPLIGILWQAWEENFGITLDEQATTTLRHQRPLEQIRASMLSIYNTVGAVASSKSDIKLQHMSGPIMMMQVFYRMFATSEGWRMALWFSVVLNVNLALLNLLPIPVLDGGHILLAFIEAVRRRPVNTRVLEIVQTACAVLIIGFMVYIAFFDVQDLPIFGRHHEGPTFSTKATPAKNER
jgi:regulator of sigma E protease